MLGAKETTSRIYEVYIVRGRCNFLNLNHWFNFKLNELSDFIFSIFILFYYMSRISEQLL
jgi:hypothetical protein